jgi:hypothetical protein
MTKYLAIYLGSKDSLDAWEKLSDSVREEREKKGMIAWMSWVKNHEKAIVEVGSPLGPTLKINKKGISKIRNDLTAFTIVEASSQEKAAEMFVDHPHFTVFPGDSIEIIECLPLPELED